MAHNFKLTGDYYVSVDGSDSNNGLTKDTPKRTIQGALSIVSISSGQTKTIIVGAGVYKENISISLQTNYLAVLYILADGLVICEPLSTIGGFNVTVGNGYGGASGYVYFSNIIIRNYDTISLVHVWANQSISFTNCTFQNLLITYSPGIANANTTQYFTNCIFINSTHQFNASLGNAAFTFDYCIFINCKLSPQTAFGWRTITNSYFNSFCILVLPTTTSLLTFNYNNIQCPIIMYTTSTVTTGVYQDVYGRYYNLSITTSTGDGTAGNPYGRPYTSGASFDFATHRILYPTFNANSFSADPKFNNIEAQNLTLQATSPHIGKASDSINNIGGTKYALRYAAKGAEFNTSAVSITGLAFVGNDWTISGGTTGEVISAPMLISSTTKVLQKISYNGLLEFNKAITPPAGGNRNVPDQEVYDSTSQPPNVAGANPDRLVYYMRYSTQTAQPTTNSEWDNGGYWTAGNYGTFEWNTKPSIDNAFLGNGDPSFNSGVTPTFLNVTWIQLKVKLRNDYA